MDLGAPGYDIYYGHGRINAFNALSEVPGTCSNSSECNDGLYCNGEEFCSSGYCVFGISPINDDGVSCTVDECNEQTHEITYTASDYLCNNNLFCDGEETCDAVNDCQDGIPPPIDDGIGCTIDICNEQTQNILHTPSNSFCSDGLFCNGEEICSSTLDCLSGTPITCDDGISCTINSCDEKYR